MINNRTDLLNDCGCCEGIEPRTPVSLHNPPGQTTIHYRVGTHATFKASLLNSLSSARFSALSSLKTRDDDDFTIGLLDSWAMIADVLTFYQERFASESYLRTATERFSVCELGNLIGYRPLPGVAASAYLAFLLEDAPGAPTKTTIGPGVQVQSIPGPDEKPQLFETVESIEARVEANEIRPRLTEPQAITTTMNHVYLEGTETGLKPSDTMLIVESDAQRIVRSVQRVDVDHDNRRTRIDFQADPLIVAVPISTSTKAKSAKVTSGSSPLSDSVIQQQVIGKSWKSEDLLAQAQINNWSVGELHAGITQITSGTSVSSGTGVYVFRKTAAVFGYNAPKRVTYSSGGTPNDPKDWKEWPIDEASKVMFLDTTYEQIVPLGYVAVDPGNGNYKSIRVQSSRDQGRTAYGISAKVTRIQLEESWWTSSSNKETDFRKVVRPTIVHCQSESLPVAKTPVEAPVQSHVPLTLDGFYPYLKSGMRIALSGEPVSQPGVTVREIRELKEVTVEGGFTTISFVGGLNHEYSRATVTLNANVSLATHGATAYEILTSGDARLTYQQATLKRSPLTYVAAANPRGIETTLSVRVNDVLWHEVPTLLGSGPNDHVFVTRMDDDGRTHLTFGDGVLGARLPSGQDNVRVQYRVGLGLDGMVDAGQLSMLLGPPLGVKAVSNPLPAAGADDRESIVDARHNAPLPLLAMGRTVSLKDYEDFTRALMGVAKAQAIWVWDGQRRIVFLTVAGPRGAKIAEGSDLHQNLVSALGNAGDPFVGVRVASYRKAFFRIEGKVTVHPDHLPDKVRADVESALRTTYSFAERRFGQPVNLSGVIATIQKVNGVVAVDVDKLYRTDWPVSKQTPLVPRLLAESARPGMDQLPLASELLLLDPAPLEKLEVIA